MRREAYLSWLLVALGMAGVEAGEPRTWTMSGGKTFEGEFVRASKKKVSVVGAEGETLTVRLDRLSEGDRAWVAEAKAAAEKLRSAAVPAALLKRLVKLDGGELKKYDLEREKGVPEYYVVYFSVSW